MVGRGDESAYTGNDTTMGSYNTSESEDNEMNEENAVTASDVDNAKYAYENALIDSENVKNSYISDINVKIESLNAEIKSLENNRNALEKAAESGNDFDEYKEAVMEKLKEILGKSRRENEIKENKKKRH